LEEAPMINEKKIIQELRLQVEINNTRTERECGNLLKEIAWILLVPIKSGICVEAELNTTAGRTDIVIIASSRSAGGFENREAYIWELKAPQLEVFELDNNRACPTKDLCIAENQLLHYHHELSQNRRWQDFKNIRYSNDVKLGGIIIGRDTNLIKCKEHEEEEDITRLAKEAIQVRKRYFYEPNHINLLTWDRVFEWAQCVTAAYQTLGVTTSSTDVSAAQPSGGIYLED
jgi:hypothetical protein